MNREDLKTLTAWFVEYSSSFSMPAEEDQRNIVMKQEHTHRVCLNAVRISRELGFDDQGILIAEAIALFHDLGRFPQYRQFRTFNDSTSVNHAALGAKVLLENDVLRDLPARERDLIIRTVTVHNVFSLPDGLDDQHLLFARLIRDADKLDILQVMLGYYGQQEADRPSAVGLGLADTDGYSADILATLERREMVYLTSMRTLNDFKLLQLAWLYDLNFAPSLKMVVERDYIGKLADVLPRTPEISRAIGIVRGYVDRKVRGEK